MFSSKDLFFTPAPSGYRISRSLRFRSSASAYLNRTPASAGNRTTYTWSGWVKRGIIGASNLEIFGAGSTAGNFDGLAFISDTIQFQLAAATVANLTTTQVFRDPSAWYHFVVAVDTTQATAANRIKLYVNGSQITAFSTATYPALNAVSSINNTVGQYIGAVNAGSIANILDGYQAEVNFIDGQALTPSSFGAYDTNGVWQPKAYVPTGTGYGTNGFYLPFSSNTSAETLAYDFSNTNSELISNSMFVSNVTGWTATGSGSPSVTWQSNHTMRLANSANNAPWAYTTISTVIGQTYYAQAYISAASIGGSSRSIILKKADDANYSVNSVDVASTTQGSAPVGLQGTFTATATTTYIIIFADVVGSGTTGVDISQVSVALGGYKKSWNPFNISLTSGTTYDSMIDSPTNYADGGNGRGNYCTINPINGGNTAVVPSNGNLTVTWGAAQGNSTIAATQAVSSGKWYFEATLTTVGGSFPFVGIIPNQSVVGSTISEAAYANNNWVGNGTLAAGDVIGVAFDLDGLTFTAYKNGIAITVASGGKNSDTIVSGVASWVPAISGLNSCVWNVNFGQRPFAYTPPSGFSALNTQNLPTPTIANGAQYMAAVTYQGATAPNTVTTTSSNSGNNPNAVTFQPDLVWIKARTATTSHKLTDSTRGVTKAISTDSTAAESTDTNGLTAFTASGFTVGSDTNYNNTTGPVTYVAWQWKKGVSQGFDIVSYAGDNTSNRNISHNLGVAPDFVWVKSLSTGSFYIWHRSLSGNTSFLKCNSTDGTNAQTTTNTPWGTGNWSSTQFMVTNNATNNLNATSTNYIAYLWDTVSGYSAFGSYTGNGLPDGPFVYTGFRPRWIMIKSSSAAGSWNIIDTSRDLYNLSVAGLYADLSNAEDTTRSVDILSNGFKCRSATVFNASATTYIWAAFAENPFKYSLAR